MRRFSAAAILVLVAGLVMSAMAIEPNFEDFESALEQPQGESVEVCTLCMQGRVRIHLSF